jgi:hypothetical protein
MYVHLIKKGYIKVAITENTVDAQAPSPQAFSLYCYKGRIDVVNKIITTRRTRYILYPSYYLSPISYIFDRGFFQHDTSKRTK